MSLEQDIENFKALIDGKHYAIDNALLHHFARPYLFTSEYLYSYFSQINFAGKRVLTTGSSGDQILVAMSCGACRVTCFDVNPFAEYIFNLKVAFIKNFDYHQIHKIFVNHIHQEGNLLNPHYYPMVKDYLPPKSRQFWDAAFANGLNTYSSVSRTVSNYHKPVCEYLYNKELFLAIKNALTQNTCAVDFITCELKDLSDNLTNKKPYDIILLSNIVDYIFTWTNIISKREDMFSASVDKLSKHNLAPNGLIQIAYSWGNDLPQLKTMFPTIEQIKYFADEKDYAVFIAPNLTKDYLDQPTFGRQ